MIESVLAPEAAHVNIDWFHSLRWRATTFGWRTTDVCAEQGKSPDGRGKRWGAALGFQKTEVRQPPTEPPSMKRVSRESRESLQLQCTQPKKIQNAPFFSTGKCAFGKKKGKIAGKTLSPSPNSKQASLDRAAGSIAPVHIKPTGAERALVEKNGQRWNCVVLEKAYRQRHLGKKLYDTKFQTINCRFGIK